MIECQDIGHDNGGTRTGYERRQRSNPDRMRDRRLGIERRNGSDRRSWLGRKINLERRDIFKDIDE
jgi:hypothetical protein